MSEEIMLYSYNAAPLTVQRKPHTGDYEISVFGCQPETLRRGIDFGVIRKKNGEAMTKHPTLFKAGAEKVAVAYGLCQRYHMESKIENQETGFFFYAVRCDLVKIVDGKEYIITSSYGSANTREGRTGSQSPYDGANSALKMAQKRALVSAALSLGCMSDSFTQDIESDTEDAGAYFADKDPEKPITPAQVKFFYTCASRHGFTKQEAKDFLRSHGYDSASKIKSGDFDALVDALQKEDS
ncbi:hypothetical protein [Dysosmobacter welbionis]|uniref:Uncharacterized protein n=1 Tax=Dysosmobacter welbionis TaxID=2093857 RepID=A0A4D7AZ84_9FIRM|nr:hypothetical protein [Dysosmobacter welbionis]QCI59122.1 hypothetical protein EIO64_07720 [Dysosmobacter welbionis]QCI60697.1 hypothetical protein EIO64_17015 [Dysosmobacter welbionis]